MNETEAKVKLSDLVAATVFPALEDAVLDRLLREARRVDVNGYYPSDDTEWAPGTGYLVDDTVVPTVRTGRVFRVSDPGTSGTVEPVWPTVDGGTVTADGVTYQDITATVTVWEGRWDFNRAAAEGWRIKAGRVSNRHDFGSNQGNYNVSQLFEHCQKMADYYGTKQVGAIVMETGVWDGTGRLNAAHYEEAV